MPLATVWGSAVVNSAISALVEGSRVLEGGAPGMGGRKLKSGGMTSGALVVTANSSGDFFCRPAASRSDWQPISATAHRPMTGTALNTFISNLVRRRRMLRLEHIIEYCDGSQRNRHIGYVENIPVI